MAAPSQLLAQTSNNATITASVNSAAINMNPAFSSVEVVAEFVGTPTGTTPQDVVTLQASLDGATWYNVGSPVATVTAAGLSVQTFSNITEPLIRIAHAVTGTTPSFGGVYVNVYAF